MTQKSCAEGMRSAILKTGSAFTRIAEEKAIRLVCEHLMSMQCSFHTFPLRVEEKNVENRLTTHLSDLFRLDFYSL